MKQKRYERLNGTREGKVTIYLNFNNSHGKGKLHSQLISFHISFCSRILPHAMLGGHLEVAITLQELRIFFGN